MFITAATDYHTRGHSLIQIERNLLRRRHTGRYDIVSCQCRPWKMTFDTAQVAQQCPPSTLTRLTRALALGWQTTP